MTLLFIVHLNVCFHFAGGFELRGRERRASEHHVQHAAAELRVREGRVHTRPQEIRRTRGIALGSSRQTQSIGGMTIKT